jgi:hypothetical protein
LGGRLKEAAMADNEKDDPVAELLRALEGGEASPRMKQLAWALGESERRRAAGKPDSAEAREWLMKNSHHNPIALNYFPSRTASEQFIEGLYAAGATKVLVDNISYDDAEGPHSDTMVVELPADSEGRARVLALCRANCSAEGSEFTDTGQARVSLWWD